ncbi:MAG: hypothetical protein ACOX89_04840 [Lutispora sp.]|uniref:hypothetical protein n=1 Tax=Lutispora sp. TaxID=2828727 RepID=UPI00356AF542
MVNIKTLLIVILLVLNIPIYRKIFYFIFRDSDDFRESVRYSFTPDIFSLLRGRYWKDQMGELKLSIFIVACIAVVFLEYLVIGSLLNVFFN